MAETNRESLPSANDALDERDVQLAREGDGQAYHRLIERRQAGIARQMWRFTRDPVQHGELVQDVFVNAWTSLDSYGGKAPFVHWLRKVAVRTGYAFWRSERKRRAERSLEPDMVAQLDDAPEDRDASEAAEIVHGVLNQLPPRDRLVLTMLYLEERSVAEISELVGWSQSMVKVQAWRARRKLKKLLEKAGVA